MRWNRGSNWWFAASWVAPRSVRPPGRLAHVLLPEFSGAQVSPLTISSRARVDRRRGGVGFAADQGTADQGTADNRHLGIMHTDYRQPLDTFQEKVSRPSSPYTSTQPPE